MKEISAIIMSGWIPMDVDVSMIEVIVMQRVC